MGARWLHAVVLEHGRVLAYQRFGANEIDALTGWLEETRVIVVAVDSPDGWSSGPHADDESLSLKFRAARCGEIGLGRQFGCWVPWVAPAGKAAAPPWMHVGVRLFQALRATGRTAIEVYPHAAFRILGGRPPLPKRTPAGARQRLDLLAAAGVRNVHTVEELAGSHDFVDATAAAVVAADRAAGTARAATCGHDGSAIWVPGPERPPRKSRPSAARVAETSDAAR